MRSVYNFGQLLITIFFIQECSAKNKKTPANPKPGCHLTERIVIATGNVRMAGPNYMTAPTGWSSLVSTGE